MKLKNSQDTNSKNSRSSRYDEADEYLRKIPKGRDLKTDLPIPLPLDFKEDVDNLENLFDIEDENEGQEWQRKYVRNYLYIPIYQH